MSRPLLLLVPPLATAATEPPALAALAELARAVRAQRDAGRDVRLYVCRGGTAGEVAERLRALDVTLLVVSLGAPVRDVAALALHDALAESAAAPPCASTDLAAWGPLARDAANIGASLQTTTDALDFGAPSPPPATLRNYADAALRRAHVALAAQMFAGNHVAARNRALLENIVP